MPISNKFSSSVLIRYLENKLGAKDSELARMIGVRRPRLNQLKIKDISLTELQIANMMEKIHKAAKASVARDAITSVVEFFPIQAVKVNERWEVFPRDDQQGAYLTGLYKALVSAKSGLYMFYDSRGRALYAGQTKRQNLWKELNSAFNRDRRTQTVTLVKHPTNNVEFKTADEKNRQPRDTALQLHDVAVYFSCHQVIPSMVDDLEALLVRALPNDLLNYKMERLGKVKRKKQPIIG